MLRNGKGLPGIGGARCYCCRPRGTKSFNRRIVRHREAAVVRKEIVKEMGDAV